MITLKDFKNGATLPSPIYVELPYVLLSDNGHGGEMVLHADNAEGMKNLGSYFDNQKIEIRQYDLYMNNNTRVDGWTLN
jgi:hypothetical protein